MFSRLLLAITLYLLIVVLVLYFRPSALIHPDGRARDWGVDRDMGRSIFSAQVAFPLLAMICYFLASWVEFTWIG